MPILTGDDVLAGLIAGPKVFAVKANQTSEGNGTFHSLWKALGQPTAGANPPSFNAGSGYIPTKDTTGALPIFNPSNGALAYLASLRGVITDSPNGILLYDRLWACSGFGTVSTSAQSVTTPGNLTAGRDPNTGADVEPWVEVYTAPGATGATWTLTGTDGNGNTNRTWVYAHPANAETAGQMMQLLPGGASPAATLGCRQVTSFTASVSSGTAGDVGITLLRRLATIGLPAANQFYSRNAYDLALERVYDDACLSLMISCSSTSTGRIQFNLGIAHK